MDKRKWGSVLAVTLLAAALAGCSSDTKETIKGSNTGDSASEGPKYTFRLADTHPEGYPTVVGDRKFAELVNDKSGGRIKVEVFPASQLGEEKAVIEQVQLGAIELTRVSTGALGGFNKEYEVFSLPYIFNSDEHLWKFLDSDKGKALLDSLESSRMKGLAYYSSGARNFYSSKPITSIADMKGLKVRVIQNKVNIDLMEALGANATPMAYGEVFGALQTGVIDAAENNYPSYDTSNHYQQAKNLILDQHQRVPEVLLVSKITWDKLSDADKKIISEAAQESVATQRAEWDRFEKQSEEKIKAAGVTITEVKDFTPWREAVKPVIEKYRVDYNDILDAIEKAE